MAKYAPQVNLKRRIYAIPLLLGATPHALLAQQVDRPVAPAGDQTVQTAVPAPQGSDEDPEGEEPEILVTAHEAPRGATFGETRPDVQFSRATIHALGINSVSELLQELAPQIRSFQGRGSDPTIILLNGRRTSGFAEVRDLPAEAIARAEILPEEVALKYGYSPDQRVVNIVLRKRFHAVIAEAADQFTTDGGRNSIDPSLSYLKIDHDRRINVTLKYQHADDLTESTRRLGPFAPRRPYDLVGNITSTGATGEIDPALSALVGQSVTIAGVPAIATSRALALSDLVASANRANVTDTTPFRTLLPSDERGSLNASYSRNIFGDIAATINGRLEASSDVSRLGLPKMKLILPAGSPFSPFAGDVAVYRYAGDTSPLNRRQKDLDGHVGLVLNGHAGAWQWSFSGTYDHSDERTRTSGAIDSTAIQAALLAHDPTVNPFGAFTPALLPAKLSDSTRLSSDTGGFDVLVNGSPLHLPAGKALASIRLGANWSGLTGQSVRDGASQASGASRSEVNGQLNIDLPLTSRRNHIVPALGDLSLNGNVAVHRLSDFGTRNTFGYGLVWSPVQPFRIIASMTNEDGAPTLAQIGAPALATPNVLVFDFSKGETVDTSRIEGSNPALFRDSRHVLKIGATWKPVGIKGFALTVNYVRARTRDASVQPAVTPPVEAAFPDRFTRDAGGTLIRFDARPVNIARDDREDLRWGINWVKAFGGTKSDGEAMAGAGIPGLAKKPNRFTLALYHTWHLRHDVLLRDGVPMLDLLNGDAMAMTGGDPRHEIEAQAGIARNGIGLRLSTNWRAATMVRSTTGVAGSDLTFSDLTTVNTRLFADLGQQLAISGRHPWLKGMKLTLAINNLFNARQRVSNGLGTTPYIYQPAFLDPLGREIRFSIRKSF